MSIKIPTAYIVVFILLLIVMMELHEVVHISVGRWICGCWGPRDFNVWDLCKGCEESHPAWWVSTMVGPLFSYAVMWVGMLLLGSNAATMKGLGFSLIFSNFPFGRITTVMMGGGDEMVVVRHFLRDDLNRTQMILIGSAIVLALGVPPIIAAYRTITNKNAWLYIAGFLTVPLMFLALYTLGGLNYLLSVGFLSADWIMGTPLLITLHTLLASTFLILLRKNLFLINQ